MPDPTPCTRKRLTRGNWTTAIWTGIAGGAGIFVCYAIAYGITDGLIPR